MRESPDFYFLYWINLNPPLTLRTRCMYCIGICFRAGIGPLFSMTTHERREAIYSLRGFFWWWIIQVRIQVLRDNRTNFNELCCRNTHYRGATTKFGNIWNGSGGLQNVNSSSDVQPPTSGSRQSFGYWLCVHKQFCHIWAWCNITTVQRYRYGWFYSRSRWVCICHTDWHHTAGNSSTKRRYEIPVICSGSLRNIYVWSKFKM